MVEFRQASREIAQKRSGGSFALGSLRPRRWRRRSVHDSPCRLSALSETCSSKPWAGPTVSARPVAWARCLGEPGSPCSRVRWRRSCCYAGFGSARPQSAGARCWARRLGCAEVASRNQLRGGSVASSARVGLSVSFIQRPSFYCVPSTDFGVGTQTRKRTLGSITSVGCGTRLTAKGRCLRKMRVKLGSPGCFRTAGLLAAVS